MRAAELFAQGRTQAEVARELDVSRQSAACWHTGFKEGGVDALRSRGPTGPAPRLSSAELAKVEQALLQGAQANGFATDLWTLERVAVVITQGRPGSAITPAMSGGSCDGGWAGRCSGLSGGPANATRKRSPAGSPMSGRGSKRGARRIGLDRLLRRVGRLADPAGAPYLVATGPHPDPAPPLRRGRRPRWRPPWATGLTAPRRGCVSTCSSPATTPTASSRSWTSSGTFYAGQQVVLIWDGLSAALEPPDARLPGQPARLAAPRRAAACLCSRAEPGRIPVGQPQRRRAGQPRDDHLGRGRRRHRTGHPTSLRSTRTWWSGS